VTLTVSNNSLKQSCSVSTSVTNALEVNLTICDINLHFSLLYLLTYQWNKAMLLWTAVKFEMDVTASSELTWVLVFSSEYRYRYTCRHFCCREIYGRRKHSDGPIGRNRRTVQTDSF